VPARISGNELDDIESLFQFFSELRHKEAVERKEAAKARVEEEDAASAAVVGLERPAP
jgi:hypothetical protein